MTKSLCLSVNSYWSSEDMKPTSTSMSLLTRDLEVRSSGSPGRDLVRRLDDYCLDLLGATNPLEFARLLQGSDSHRRQTLEELLEWTALDNDFLLIALVALAPELERSASRLSWGRPSNDTVSEVLTQATIALRWTQELVEGERVDFVLAHAQSKTRSEQRRMARHNVPTVAIPDDFDQEEPEMAHYGASAELLSSAVERNILTSDESLIIQRTRGDSTSMRLIAEETGASYEAVKKRRNRAERKLRQHLVATESNR
jgi:DNA-directed RNA polymerase specialized sigma24 family protein